MRMLRLIVVLLVGVAGLVGCSAASEVETIEISEDFVPSPIFVPTYILPEFELWVSADRVGHLVLLPANKFEARQVSVSYERHMSFVLRDATGTIGKRRANLREFQDGARWVWWQVDNSTLRISATPDVARSELERFVDGMSETDTTGRTSFIEGKRRLS